MTLEHASAELVAAPPKDAERCDRCDAAQLDRRPRV